MSFSRRQKRERTKLKAAPVDNTGAELGSAAPRSDVTRLSSSDDSDEESEMIAFLEEGGFADETSASSRQSSSSSPPVGDLDGVQPGASASPLTKASAIVPGSPSSALLSNAPSPGSSILPNRVRAGSPSPSSLLGSTAVVPMSNIGRGDVSDDSDSEDDAIARSLLASGAPSTKNADTTNTSTSTGEDLTQVSPARPSRAAARAARQKIDALAQSSSDESEDEYGAALNAFGSLGEDAAVAADTGSSGRTKNAPALKSSLQSPNVSGSEPAEDEWKPASSSSGRGKNAQASGKRRGPGESSKGLQLPFGGLLSEELFLKLASHARKTQEFSPVDTKELTKERHQLPSWCFLSIYESAERMGQLQRRFPFCDAKGLIHRDLVQRLRKEIRRFKKQKDLAKRQESPFHQTPYTAATEAAGLMPMTVNSSQLSVSFASLLLSRANKLFDLVWDGTVPAITLSVRGESLTESGASAAASILDRAWMKMNDARMSEAEAKTVRAWQEKEASEQNKSAINASSTSEDDASDDENFEIGEAGSENEGDASEVGIKKKKGNKAAAMATTKITELSEEDKAMKNAAIAAAKVAASILPRPPALIAAAEAALAARRAARDAAIAAAAGVANSNEIQANEALRDLLSSSSNKDTFAQGGSGVSAGDQASSSSNITVSKTISKSSLLQKMMSRRASVVTSSGLEAVSAREAELKKIAEKEAARTRKVIENLSGKGQMSTDKKASLSSLRVAAGPGSAVDEDDAEMELDDNEHPEIMVTKSSEAVAVRSEETASGEREKLDESNREDDAKDDNAKSSNANDAEDVMGKPTNDNGIDVNTDDDESDNGDSEDDGLTFVDVSPVKPWVMERTLRQKSGDKRVCQALDMCVKQSKVGQKKKKAVKKAMPGSHRRSVLERLKKSLGENKLKHHAQRNGFHSMDQLRRAEQREELAKAQEQAQRLEQERMQNVILGNSVAASVPRASDPSPKEPLTHDDCNDHDSFGDDESSGDEAGIEENEAASFEAASKFEGQRAGMLYKKGDQGLGYYADKTNGAKNSKKEKMVRKDNKVESSESSPSVSSLVPVAVQMAKRMVTKTRVVEETVEDEFGFPVTKMREETYEVEEAVAVEGPVDSTAAAHVDPAHSAAPSGSSLKDARLKDAPTPEEVAQSAPNMRVSESAVSAADIAVSLSSSSVASASAEDPQKAVEAVSADKHGPIESEESGESDVAGDERSDDDEPKRDKAAGFRALLEKEQREIRQRKKAKRKVAGIFEEEASEDEDEAQEGLGEYGDQDKKRKQREDEEELRIDNMEDQITAADLEGVVDAPSDNEGDDNVDMDQVHAKMMRDQDKQEQEELIRQVQDGWANNGKRGGRRRRGQFDEGYMNEGANNRHRKRLRLDGSEDDENEEDEEGLDEEDMLARRAERDAIRRGSDDEARYSDEYDEDEEGDEGFNNRNKVDAEELAERNAAAAVRRRAYRSQALRKQKITADMDIANGGRGPNILRQQSVVEDDDESQRILGLTRRHNDASQNSLMARVADSSQNGGYDASLLAVDSAGLVGIEAAGGGKNMQTLYARVTAGQGAGSSVGSSSSASSSSFSSLGKRRRPKSCEPSIGGSTASNAAALSATNVFQPFSRRTFTQMSSFRTSSISISQHSWSSKSQSSNAQAIVKDRGSKKAFVWRTDSQSMSQFGGLDGDGESGGGGGGGAFSFRPLSNGAVSRDGITKGKTPGTAARGHRGAVMHHRGGGPGLPSASDSMIGSKRPASGGLFQALSSSNNFRKKARA